MGPFRVVIRATPLLAALCALAASPLAAQSTINQFPLTSDIQPLGIAAGPDGNLWYAVFGNGSPGTSKVGRITTAGAVTEFILPDTSWPVGIVAGPDNAMWFTESANGAAFSSIGRVDPVTFPAAGSVTHFTTGLTALANPFGICVGPDNNLWFAERNNNAIAQITTLGVVTEFPIGAPTATPLGIVAGPDGNLWFTDRGTNSSIGVMSTSGAVVKRINTPTAGGNPTGITVGPDGRMWFVEFDGNKVGVVATSGTLTTDITEYTTPTATPFRIVSGPDGALWFTENNNGPGGKVARITTSGTITEYTTTGLAGPYGIALGPDRAIWFTEGYPSSPAQIGQLLVDCVVIVPTITGGGAQCAGTTLTLTASGGWTSYQWYLNGSAIGGATSATYTKTADGGDTGSYTVTGTNGSCTSNASAPETVTITAQPTATVGGPQTICVSGTTASLGGNTPAGGATGAWSIVTGGVTGTFSPSATTPSATFTHSGGAVSSITLRWTVSNPPCADATADVVVTISQPPTAATAGGPQTICNLGTTAGLGGNTPAVGTGTWSVVSGGTGTFSPNATTPNATFTHSGGAGPIVLAWTISNSPCAPSVANVTITVTQPPTTATAGSSQTICNLGNSLPLGGNTPAVGTGTWTIVGGGTGTFNPNATTPNATFTHTSGAGPITVRWTISNPPCTSSTADVVLTIGPDQTVMITAPPSLCASSVSTASVPDAGTGSTYTWTISNGTITAGQGTNAITFTAGPSGNVTFGVTIMNSSCTSNGSLIVPIDPLCEGPFAFVPVPPCRRIDTRLAADAPALDAGEQRTLVLTDGPCTIPSTAKAVSINVAITASTAKGDLKLFATGTTVPVSTTMNFGANQTRANNALVELSADGTGRVDVKNDATGTVHVIIDVNGYFQ